MKQITDNQMKELFIKIPLLKSVKTSLESDLKRVTEYDSWQDDAIDAINFNFILSDMPRSGNISDKTSKAALKVEDIACKEKREILQQILNEIRCVDNLLQKVDLALNSLSEDERLSIVSKYWEKKTWDEVARESMLSVSQTRRVAAKAIQKINIIARIRIEDYEVLKINFG
ncbi:MULTISPECIES: hypothetical protein [unclassified Sedimentibacter]|uniref:hypothetical protein n=1 Tax=unclassified Sedimentibacter TaxID=2649220 RepID=UPI0027E206EB|nr:hypothetical protein [Sedimentibacter sp. MB35-C1]WMJ78465.1 hypothetical protein RBQ61_05965 [Sedimentibacter sp. MB35-C1]